MSNSELIAHRAMRHVIEGMYYRLSTRGEALDDLAKLADRIIALRTAELARTCRRCGVLFQGPVCDDCIADDINYIAPVAP